MLGRLIPSDDSFFDSFDQLAAHLTKSAGLLATLFGEPARQAEQVKAIKDVEHLADELMHSINQRLDKTFITPFDREDIHTLSVRLDDVIDLIDGTARRYEMLRITEVKPEAKELARILCDAGQHIQQAVRSLKKPTEVNRFVSEIKRLEEEGDAIYHTAVGALFDGHIDAIDVIRWKEMFDTLEKTIDQCMGVAQALQSIALKNG